MTDTLTRDPSEKGKGWKARIKGFVLADEEDIARAHEAGVEHPAEKLRTQRARRVAPSLGRTAEGQTVLKQAGDADSRIMGNDVRESLASAFRATGEIPKVEKDADTGEVAVIAVRTEDEPAERIDVKLRTTDVQMTAERHDELVALHPELDRALKAAEEVPEDQSPTPEA